MTCDVVMKDRGGRGDAAQCQVIRESSRCVQVCFVRYAQSVQHNNNLCTHYSHSTEQHTNNGFMHFDRLPRVGTGWPFLQLRVDDDIHLRHDTFDRAANPVLGRDMRSDRGKSGGANDVHVHISECDGTVSSVKTTVRAFLGG